MHSHHALFVVFTFIRRIVPFPYKLLFRVPCSMLLSFSADLKPRTVYDGIIFIKCWYADSI